MKTKRQWLQGKWQAPARALLVAASASVLLGLATSAWSQQSDPDVVHACVSEKDGLVRIVGEPGSR